MTQQSYKLVVSYDGTDYRGWQEQQEIPTIIKTLKDHFRSVFSTDCSIVGASRTDAGVHALGQVALLTTPLVIAPQALCHAWNNKLPASIAIQSVEQAAPDFHPQRNVLQKTYFYHFFTERPVPFAARYGWFYRYPVDIQKLEAALQVFVGTHDFRSFCTLDSADTRSTIRTIDSFTCTYVEQFGCFRIIVRGQSFLHFMIRRLVGACLTVAAHDTLDIVLLQQALAEKNPQQSLPKAPAQGLMLYNIRYEKDASYDTNP